MQQKRSYRSGWLRISLAGLVVTCAVIFGIAYFMLFKLIGRKLESLEEREQRHARAHAIFYDQLQGVNVSFHSSDGKKLHGVLVRRSRASGTVILCHGFRRDKEGMARYAELFPDYNLLFFDFRASGASDGTYSSIGCHEYRDVAAAVNFVKKAELDGMRPLIILGVSMGASAAIKAAKYHPDIADALILDSAYANLYDTIMNVFGNVSGLPLYPFFPVMMYMFSYMWGKESTEMVPEDYIENLELPAFIIHSVNDSFTLPEHSMRLYAKVGAHNIKSRFWIGPPAKHGYLFDTYPDYYRSKINRFIEKVRSRWLSKAEPAA